MLELASFLEKIQPDLWRVFEFKNVSKLKNADYLIDMGPEGGSKGGQIIAVGSPKELAASYKETGSYTGEYLAKEFGVEV